MDSNPSRSFVKVDHQQNHRFDEKKGTHHMKNLAKAALLVATLFTAISVTPAQVSIGIRIGPPPPPHVVRVHPVSPGPDFLWVEGYWYPVGGHYRWHEGYWTQPPYAGARWVGPHHDGQQFYAGYWDGPHGRFEHDHRWDHDRDRDYHHDRDDHHDQDDHHDDHDRR